MPTYVPQMGDVVSYMRGGHQQYLEISQVSAQQ